MGNLAQSKPEYFKEVSGRASTPLFNITSQDDSSIYIMLNGGRVCNISKESTLNNETSCLMLESTPNERLLKQFSNFLKDAEIPHTMQKLSGVLTVSIKNPRPFGWGGFSNVMITSKPFNGLSYVHAVLLSEKSTVLGVQINASFIAHTPIEILKHLIRLNLVRFGTCEQLSIDDIGR